jgi:hypothetical protein
MESDFDDMYKYDRLLVDKYFQLMKKDALGVTPIQHYEFAFTKAEEKILADHWHNGVRSATEMDRSIARIQVCDLPLTKEMKNLLAQLKAEDKYGGRHYAMTTVDFMKLARNWDLNTQFWIFDDRRTVLSYFSNDGHILGYAEPVNEKLISRLAAMKKRCLESALPVSEFLAKYGKRR